MLYSQLTNVIEQSYGGNANSRPAGQHIPLFYGNRKITSVNTKAPSLDPTLSKTQGGSISFKSHFHISGRNV
jgi:hypothetical protein